MSTPPNAAAKQSLCYAKHKTPPSTVEMYGENGEVAR